MTTHIVICHQDPLWRTGLRVSLEAAEDFEVIGETSTVQETVRAAIRLNPDLVMLEGAMLDRREPNVIDELANLQHGRSIPVIVLGAPVEERHLLEVLRAGARGLLHKGVGAEEVLSTARVIAAGEAAISPPVARRLLGLMSRFPTPAVLPISLLAQLTRREAEILRLVAKGWSIAEIAKELSLGTSTVKSHFYHVRQKLGLKDRVQAVIFAYENGLVSPGVPGSRSGAEWRG